MCVWEGVWVVPDSENATLSTVKKIVIFPRENSTI